MNRLRGSILVDKLVQLVKRDFWRKLIALFFASLLYYYVNNEILPTAQRIDNVPVDVVLPPGLMEVEPKPRFATLSIKSNLSVSPSMLRGKVTVDYSRYIPGKPYVVTLTPEHFSPPFGVRIVGIDRETNKISLNLQPQMSRDVPVKVKFSGELSRDYRSSCSSYIPATVRVTGPESQVRDLKSVSTLPVPLSEEVTEGFEYDATLKAPNGTTISPGSVTCQIDVVKNFEQRSFPALPVQLLTRAGGKLFKAEFVNGAQVEIIVRGPAGALSALPEAEVRPYLDISHIDKPGIYEISVGCYVKGEGLDVKAIRPALLKVKITE